MTPKQKNDPITYEDLISHYQTCSANRRSLWRWVASTLIGFLMAACGLLYSEAKGTNQDNSRQDAQIQALQKTDDLLRSDLAEIKADLKAIVQVMREQKQ